MRRFRKCIAAVLAGVVVASQASAQTAGGEWAGVWRGSLTNLPVRANATPVDVMMEIGTQPTADSTCATWRTTYSEGGTVRQVKDYKLCRGAGPDDLYIDEGDGIKLAARWIGDVLVSPFKVDDLLLVSTVRLRGEVLEHEILTVSDRPAVKGVQPLSARGIQRLLLRRTTAGTPPE